MVNPEHVTPRMKKTSQQEILKRKKNKKTTSTTFHVEQKNKKQKKQRKKKKRKQQQQKKKPHKKTKKIPAKHRDVPAELTSGKQNWTFIPKHVNFFQQNIIFQHFLLPNLQNKVTFFKLSLTLLLFRFLSPHGLSLHYLTKTPTRLL